MPTSAEPISGVKGGSPRPSTARLNDDYLAERNAALALKRRSAEIDLAIREGTLLPAGPLRVQLSFLLTSAREAVRAWHVKLPPLLFNKDLHQISQILREAEAELLNHLAGLPAALGNGVSEDATSLASQPAGLTIEEEVRKAKHLEKEERRKRRLRARRAALKRGEGP
jgi:hypothetical protein